MIKHWLMWGLFAVLSVAALISSLGTAFQTLPLNPDMAEMALIYQGIVHHGWRFPFTWRFNQDNQFLSLLPFALIFYALVGVSGASIVIQGWLIFVVNAMLSGLVVKTVTRSWMWGYLAWLIALLAGPMAIGQPGILAYPVSHNAVWMFGLIGIIALLRYIIDKPRWAFPTMLVCVFTGTVSDPWFQAAYTLPIIFLLWKAPALFSRDKSDFRIAIKWIVAAYVVGRITYFIFADFNIFSQQSISFASPSIMLKHLILLTKGIGTYLCLYPLPTNFISLVVWFIFIFSVLVVFCFAIIYRKLLPASFIIVILFAFYSSALMSILFVVTNFATGGWAIEYLINIFYLFILSLLAIAYVFESMNFSARIFTRASVIAYLVLSMTLIVNGDFRFSPNWGETKKVVYFLVKNHLYFGYGSYFGAQSPLFALASDGAITGRHMGSNMGLPIIQMGNGDKGFWYSDPSKETTPQFIIFSKADSELISITKKYIGPPNRVIYFLNYTIFIYDRNLLPHLLANRWLSNNRWRQMNIERNVKGINKVCRSLNINPLPIEHAYIEFAH
ncbi:hypothetical protein [Acidithiobacillus thiooxidans]|uniref:Glycosyltransferase RgtA/B/C/D-like domain-containing protein n=1 Tax=Acidithiobacillus thiooxidans ATCC 19377 TaxID=637390 RepID=A0A5P9XSD5_ACITH|nr:hypothetical protein [Acidithiobacillus thiooxidans]QFX96658.1 hypothetical protein GCD22_02468 [Acidithiobacillus thiooxidans ATCC 19377]